MAKALLAVLAGAAIVAAGCTATDETDGSATTSDSGKAPVSTTDATTSPSTDEMASCQLCGKEVPSAELVMHDGKMACKACIESHGH
ncbi:MAG: hypothetical protein WD716_00195 [Fimbriimonadaceae bacterium]